MYTYIYSKRDKLEQFVVITYYFNRVIIICFFDIVDRNNRLFLFYTRFTLKIATVYESGNG